MNRAEFLDYCKDVPQEELVAIARKYRDRANSRVPEQMKVLFRTLDDATTCEEHFLETAATEKLGTKSHIYVIKPADSTESMPVMINVHGGGWTMPHTERDIYFCRRIANRLKCLVIDIDYVLAPEYKYPAALIEMEAIYDELHTLIPQWGGDLNNIVICGQSAGGNLTAAVSQRKQYQPFPGLKAQILCYSPCDNYNDHFDGGELDDRGKNTEYYGFFYNRTYEERKNSDVSLVYATDEDLAGIPATDFIIARIDNLVAEQEKYCRLLKDHGFPVTCRTFEKSKHGFIINMYDEWQEGEDYVAELLTKHFAE